MRYYLFTLDKQIEEVNEFVFENAEHALNDSGNLPRYGHNQFFTVDDNGDITIGAVNLNANQFAAVMRILNIVPLVGSSPRGLYDTPTHIPFKKGRSQYLYDLKQEIRYRAEPQKLAA